MSTLAILTEYPPAVPARVFTTGERAMAAETDKTLRAWFRLVRTGSYAEHERLRGPDGSLTWLPVFPIRYDFRNRWGL